MSNFGSTEALAYRYRMRPIKEDETAPPKPLLYDEDNNISSQILLGQEVEALRFIPFDPKTDSWELTTKMKEYVAKTGLQHLAELKKSKIDHAIINALIERWRPQTNTFHFVCGETTITLGDISYLYGLPIDGKAVMGSIWSDKRKLSETCSRLLGVKDSSRPQLGEGPIECALPRKAERQHDVDRVTIPWRKTTFSSAHSPPSIKTRKPKSPVGCAAHEPVQRRRKAELLPPLVSSYPSKSRKGDPLPKPKCILSSDELTLLEKF
ncbi:hypothetical protein MRB53_006685 [Persea americana]|uniref:Uncharacterized protein n=1 Tax=Persea americana TaxID=3435 RepID=A0ACC2MGQ5_PERAE|nr:hypothetical protein MRB53_006685 [Persea americana]